MRINDSLHTSPEPTSNRQAPRARTRTRSSLLVTLVLAMVAPAAPWFVSSAHAQGDKKGGDDAREAAPPDGTPEDAGATPEEQPPAEQPPASDAGTDIDGLRQEYLRLRDELFRSRARAASVASAMYSTRVRIFLTYGSGRFHAITRATIRLDGANVYDDASGAIGNDAAVRFEGFVAPGRHEISIRIETTAKDDERFSSISENTFTIQAPAGKDVIVTAKAQDKGDLAYAWQKKEKGTLQPVLSVSVKTQKRADAPASAAAKTASPKPESRSRARVSASGGSRGK